MGYDYLGNVERGDKVIVSTSRDFRDPMFGEVIDVGSAGVNIRYFTQNSFGVLRFCWHEDDPRMEERGKFEESYERNKNDRTGVPGTGVFRFTQTQQQAKELPGQLRTVHEKIDALDQTVERLARQVNAPKRGAGRRETQPAEDAA